MLRFWLPTGHYEREIILPLEAVEGLLRSAVHEAGHAEVASHFGARVLGIAITWEPQGLIAMALYVLPRDLDVDDIGTIYAAGSAGEILEYGNYTVMGASRDRQDVETLHGEVPFELLVEKAKKILAERRTRFDHIASVLREKFFNSNDHLTMGFIPNGKMGVFVMNENQF